MTQYVIIFNLIFLTSWFSACERGPAEKTAAPNEAITNTSPHLSANEIVLALDREPQTVDWHQALEDEEYFVVSFLMAGLMRIQGQVPICHHCSHYQVLDEGREYRFQMKAESRWSDGQALLAQHFVDGFERLKKLRGKSLPLPFKASASGQELTLKLKNPDRSLLHWLTTPESFPLRKEMMGNPEKDQGAEMSLVVLGPYLLAEWQRGQRMVLEKNPEYRESQLPMHRAQLIFGNRGDLLQQFKENKLRLHVLSNPTTQDIMALGGATLKISPYWAVRTLIINVERSMGANQEIRRSLLLALNRQDLPGYLANGEKPATHLIPPGVLGHRNLPTEANLNSAQSARHRAMDWSKWLEVQLLVRNTPLELKLASWVSEELQKIRIRVNIRSEKAQGFQNALKQGEFDLALVTLGMRTAHPLEILQNFSSESPLNYGHWKNESYDELLRQAQQIDKEDEFDQSLQLMIRHLQENQIGAIPLTYPIRPFLLNPRVENFSVTPFGNLDLIKIQVQK